MYLTRISILLMMALISIIGTAQETESNFLMAKEKATQEGKQILMVFSGSDWCKPCIQLKKEVLSQDEFLQYKEDHLIHLELDFPYRKENQLSETQLRHNEELAEEYNPKGAFPAVLLLNSKGDVLKKISYKKGMSPEDFIKNLTASI